MPRLSAPGAEPLSASAKLAAVLAFSLRSAVVAALVIAAGAVPATAAGPLDDLVHRVAAANGGTAGLRIAHGALPPGFAFANPVPSLALLGSSWPADASPPDDVRIYYRPAAATSAEAAALAASLTRRGYVRAAASGFVDLFVGDDGPTQRWCPTDFGPALFLTVTRVRGTPRALDVEVLRAPPAACAAASRRSSPAGVPLPVLGNVAGLRIGDPARSAQPHRLVSTAVVRSALLESEVLARLGARFAAAGWHGEAPVVDGDALEQRFVRAGASRWTLDLRLDERASGAYDATIVATTP